MTRELVAQLIQEGTNCQTKVAYEVVNRLVDLMTECLRDNHKYLLANFGSFRVCDVKRTIAINPKTHELMDVKPSLTVRFKASPALRKNVVPKKTRAKTAKK